jgi:hypothetical protein
MNSGSRDGLVREANQQKESAMRHHREFNALVTKAHAAGMAAGDAAQPTAMVVSEHANALDDASPVRKQWYVADGVCGFAWVTIRPGTSSFARWMVKHGHARKAYGGGISTWVSQFGQSMQRKQAYAAAFAKVLSEAGINAYADSRMD